MYNKYDRAPLNFSPAFPYFQLKFEVSGQVTTPCVKLSDFGVLGLNYDVAMMTNCQYSGRTMYMVRYDHVLNKLYSFVHIASFDDLSFTTHFNFKNCFSLRSGHLEQLAIACPNLQRLNLQDCFHCLESLQGLQTIASHCHNLQELNLLGILASLVEDHSLLWEILSDMKLTHLAGQDCIVLKSDAVSNERLICLYKKCWTIRGIQCGDCCCEDEDILMLSYFPSLQYCYIKFYYGLSTIVQDVINNCKELTSMCYIGNPLSLNLTRNYNLQQLYLASPGTDVTDNFMTSVSAHGGLVHVVMKVRSLKFEGITSLVRNSPALITLYLLVSVMDAYVENFNAALKKMFWNRKLFTAGLLRHTKFIPILKLAMEQDNVLWEQGTDLLPLWY